ncbi:MAG: O-antigen ligase family protein [Actinomycetota bacterium]
MDLLTLAIGGLAAICAWLWAVRDPMRTIVPAYAALIPLGGVLALRIPLPPPFNTLSSAAGALAIVALAVHLLRSGRGRVPSLPVGAWLLFVAWGAITVLWSVDPTDVVREMTLAVPLLAIMVLVAMEPADEGDLRRVAWATLASSAAIGAYGIALIVVGGSLPEHGLSARFSLGANPADTNPNQLAASLLLPFFLGLGLTLDRHDPGAQRWRAYAAPGGTILTGVAIVLSGSRGGALATAVGSAVFVALAWRWSPWRRGAVRRLVAAGIAGAAALVLAGVLATSLAPDGRIASLLAGDAVSRLGAVESSSGRAEIWTAGALACTAYCGVGSGLGTFPGVYNDVFAFSNVTRNVGASRPGHNLYLEIAVETGLLGIVLFWMAIGSEFRAIARRRASWLAPALAAAIVAILVADIFEGFLWFKHAWLPFTVIRVFESAADRSASADTRREAAFPQVSS